MEIIDIKKRHFDALTEYIIPDNIPSNESQLYHYHHLQEKLLLKKYDITDDDKYIGNKLLTISLLHHYKDQIDIPELIIPKYLVSIDKKVSGCLVPFIQNNTNLSILLQSKDISTATKKHFLKEVLRIVKKVQGVKIPKSFYLGDLHEANFILNHDDSKIYVVDVDGCKIGNNEVYIMKYTADNNIKFINKSQINGNNERHVVNYNTDWYSFAMMVLNTIGGEKTYQLKREDFFDYLELLRSNQFSEEIVDYFANLYTNNDNINEMTAELIDQIPNDLSNVGIHRFIHHNDIKYIYLPKKKLL